MWRVLTIHLTITALIPCYVIHLNLRFGEDIFMTFCSRINPVIWVTSTIFHLNLRWFEIERILCTLCEGIKCSGSRVGGMVMLSIHHKLFNLVWTGEWMIEDMSYKNLNLVFHKSFNIITNLLFESYNKSIIVHYHSLNHYIVKDYRTLNHFEEKEERFYVTGVSASNNETISVVNHWTCSCFWNISDFWTSLKAPFSEAIASKLRVLALRREI